MSNSQKDAALSLNDLMETLNCLDSYVYVTEMDTDEILFVNDRLASQYGVRAADVTGKICWQALPTGQPGRCSYCPISKLDEAPEKVITWIHSSKITGRHYQKTDRIIKWGGRNVHLQSAVDITDIMATEFDLKHRLEQQELLFTISKSFLSTEDTSDLIEHALQLVGEFFDASKLTVSHLRSGNMVREHGWFNRSHDITEIGNCGNFPLLPGNQAFAGFMSGALPYLTCNDATKEPAYSFLLSFNIRACIIVPIHVFGRFWGIIAVNDRHENRIWEASDIQMMQMIGNIISELIGRMETEKQLIAAKEEAEHSSQAKGDFLSRMSHEMRTPMNAIIGMTSIARNSDDSDRIGYCLERIDTASNHLLGVINDVLDMSKIESGKFEIAFNDFNLEKMLINVTNVFNYRIEDKKLEVLIKIGENLPLMIHSDEQRLAQVMTNLIGNAVKFTPDNGKILLEILNIAEQPDGLCTLQISVRDTGIGISKEQQSRLFQSFEQADGSISRKYGGTGLGLAISKKIVELLGGTISVHSEPGEGSSFIFTVDVKRIDTEPGEHLPFDPNQESPNLMLIDESAYMGEGFTAIAHSLRLSSQIAKTADDACSRMEQGERFDMIFVDWMVPGMEDFELIKKIKRINPKTAIVLLIPAAKWNLVASEAMAAGVCHFSTKPLFGSAIAECLNRYLNISGHTADDSDIKTVDTTPDYSSRTLLLAEDIEINCEIFKALLAPSGIGIDWAENGRIAYDMYRADPQRYDIIFMDIHMPDTDGYEATRMIRSLPCEQAQTIPIIALTADVFRKDIERCLAAGMNDHLSKPLDFNSLLGKLKVYIH